MGPHVMAEKAQEGPMTAIDVPGFATSRPAAVAPPTLLAMLREDVACVKARDPAARFAV
jgi:hypothetical protein